MKFSSLLSLLDVITAYFYFIENCSDEQKNLAWLRMISKTLCDVEEISVMSKSIEFDQFSSGAHELENKQCMTSCQITFELRSKQLSMRVKEQLNCLNKFNTIVRLENSYSRLNTLQRTMNMNTNTNTWTLFAFIPSTLTWCKRCLCSSYGNASEREGYITVS